MSSVAREAGEGGQTCRSFIHSIIDEPALLRARICLRLRRATDLATRFVTPFLARLQFTVGAVAHLVERFHGMEEVRGSSPLSSTIRRLTPHGKPWARACPETGAEGPPQLHQTSPLPII